MSEAFPADASMAGSYDRSEHPYLDDGQWAVLVKMDAVNGRSSTQELLRCSPDEVIARIARFREYEEALERHFMSVLESRIPAPAAAPAPTVTYVTSPAPPAGPKPIRVKISPYSGNENENLIFWQREVELALVAGCIQDARQCVTFAISHMAGRAKTWALTCETTQPGYFGSWPTLVEAMKVMFLPPNVSYRQRVAFLACVQGDRDLYTYVQELRQLRASMVANAIPHEIQVTVFMEGLNVGPAKSALFRAENPFETLEDAIRVAIREDQCDRQARGLPIIGTPTVAPPASGSGSAEPMDLSVIDLSNVDLSTMDLSAIDTRALHIKCYTCDKMGHYQRNCPRNRANKTARNPRMRGSSASSKTKPPLGNGSSQ